MATLVTLGLSKILGKVGEPTALNFTETGYTAFGLTYEDTCKNVAGRPGSNRVLRRGRRRPGRNRREAGKITFSFSIMNPELPVLKRLFGGEIASDVWSYPEAVNTVEESIIILPKKGLKFQVPRMKLVAKINGEFSKKGLLLIEVTGTVMKPTTSGLKKMAVGKVSASTASVSS